MAIPKSFVEKYIKKAEGAQFFGVEINEMSKEELIACAISGWEKESKTRAEGIRMIKFMQGRN